MSTCCAAHKFRFKASSFLICRPTCNPISRDNAQQAVELVFEVFDPTESVIHPVLGSAKKCGAIAELRG